LTVLKNKFSISNIKKNWNQNLQDPFASVKFNYKVTKIFVYFIMGIISIIFIRLIYTQIKSFNAYSLLIGGFMGVIMVYLLYNIYSKILLPQRKIMDHYENVPTPISSHHINVKAEVDEILNKFDKSGKKIK